MIITVDNGALEKGQDIDDLIYNSLKDAPFFIDKATFTRIQ